MTCDNPELANIRFACGLRQAIRTLILLVLHRILALNFKTILVISERAKRFFQTVGYKNIIKVPLGFDKSVIKRHDDAQNLFFAANGLERNTTVFGFFGRMVPEKGFDLLLGALETLSEETQWVLLLDEFSDTETPYGAEIKQRISSSSIRAKIFPVDPSHEEVARDLSICDFLVLPSRDTARWKEQYGRLAIEGLAIGCVPIISPTESFIENVGEHSIIIEELNIDGVRNALCLAIKARAQSREKMSVEGRMRFSNEKFSSEDTSEQLYKAILGEMN